MLVQAPSAHPQSVLTARVRLSGLLCCALLLSMSPSGYAAEGAEQRRPCRRVHAFYYPWYGNPQTDGAYSHWNHPVAVRNEPARQFPGGDDIGANFYPALGCYSSNDSDLVDQHMRQLRRARVGVISVSWWGKDSFTDRALPLLLRAAQEHGIQICFHVEPHIASGGRDAKSVRDAIVYLLDAYGASPALYRDANRGDRPVFYVYDSYLTEAAEWATILSPDAADTLRGTKYDSLVIGLWVKQDEERFFLDGHFDGLYTYFATDGFTYGSTWENWKTLADWARDHDKLFVPCVAPGYVDTRIRPWNGKNTRNREDGAYYDRAFEAAIEVEPDVIGITSFNEWHEGTQIEPAIAKRAGDYRYEDYDPHEPAWYLDRTAHWVGGFESASTPHDSRGVSNP